MGFGGVSDNDFYGRDELVEHCYQSIKKNNRWLLGRRGSGKASILYAIKKVAIEKNDGFPVFLDLSQYFDDEEIKDGFLLECQENLRKFGLQEEFSEKGSYNFVALIRVFYKGLTEQGVRSLLLLF